MKKFKLFTTIASMCLAVALMAFGVYAATNATFGVFSNIKYTVSGNIGGTLTVNSYASKDGITIAEGAKAMETFTETVNATMTDEEAGKLKADETTPSDSSFTADNKYVIYVVEFDETTSENVVLQVESVTLKKGTGESAITTTEISVTNALQSAVPAETQGTVNKYNIVVKLDAALNADTTFTVEFNVKVSIPQGN